MILSINLDANVESTEPEQLDNNNKKKVEQSQSATEPSTIGDLVGTDSEEDEATNNFSGSYRINW